MPNTKKEISVSRENWLQVNVQSLSDPKKEVFINRKQAIDSYLDGDKTLEQITLETGIKKADIYRLLKRCQQVDKKGQIFGYRALIPFYRTKEYELKLSQNLNGFENEYTPKTGAFNFLLEQYPAIRLGIENLVFKKNTKEDIQTKDRVKDIHKKFIKICKSVGLNTENGKYPFNTKDLGRRSLYRFVKDLKENNPQKVMADYGKDAKMLFNNTGLGDKNNIIERPFERVEFDGHKLDVNIAVRFTNPEGDENVDIIHRIWLLAVVDIATNVTLSSHICLNKEYSEDDVMFCIRKAVLPWTPTNLTIPGLKMPKEGGFASEIIPATMYAVWDEICFDNAKAHLDKKVKHKLKKILGCAVNYGPVGTPTRRPKIEKLFHIIEDEGFHRSISTTGNNPNDPRREDSEKSAIKYEVSAEEIEQLTEVLFAIRNGRPQRSLNNLSPLEVLQQRINRNYVFRKLDEQYRDGKEFMVFQDTRTIRGSLKDGRRPYIRYEGVDYRNEVLSESFSLIGTTLALEVDTEDVRYIKAYLPDGGELGILRAQGKWCLRKHSLRIRKAINKLIYRGELHFLNEDDPIQIYHDFLKEKAKSNRNIRNKLVHLEQLIKSDKNIEEIKCETDSSEDTRPNTEKVLSNSVNVIDYSAKKKPKQHTDRISFNF
ncbi:hypothetical protein [Bacillus canaveralius]|uniref:hypothetical protein n=1 Tax=Bacillus canaveralius TaxID=1403243 RepID=UPI000F7A41CE|nr:hypothetical protein [Bacillus canaveralius]RSK49681.1 hypothetical protein EJA13_15495 [Bacillus canaveralius]